MLLRLAAFISTVVLVACSPAALSIQGGDVVRYEGGRPSEHWKLTTEQGNLVSAWLNSHRSDWKLDLLGDYVPSLLANMHGNNGPVRLNVLGTSVIYYDGHHQYSASFGAQDIANLREALGGHATANPRLERP